MERLVISYIAAMGVDCTVTELALPEQYDLGRTLWLAGMGKRDPTLRVGASEATVGIVAPTGPVCVKAIRHDSRLFVECFGTGNSWIEPRLPGLFGLHDRPQDFQPNGKAGELVRNWPGVHLPTMPVVFHRLVQIVLQQLVSWNDALHGWRQIVGRFGTDAPVGGIRLPPSPRELSRLGYFDLVDCGVLPRQARIILRLSREARRIDRLADESRERLSGFLLNVPGIGEWTVQHLLGSSCGDADAVLTGDFSLPNTVAWFFAGKERSDDREMLELLEPFTGHRFRVLNLLMQSGIEAPRHGPRMRTNRWRFSKRSRG